MCKLKFLFKNINNINLGYLFIIIIYFDGDFLNVKLRPSKKINIEFKWFYLYLTLLFFININLLWAKEGGNLYKRELNIFILCEFLMTDFRLAWIVIIWNRCGLDQMFLSMTSYIWYLICVILTVWQIPV